MDKDEIDSYIFKKINECGDYVRISYYDIVVRHKEPIDELEEFIEEAKGIFEKQEYKVYLETKKYVYNHCERTVQSNEIIVAIKNNEN
ncbi:MAG: hypothetical protein IJJ82_03115 [Clostridia bacterium]|nr:hypothetical protein [Clostridia bacterium]